jgi:hypothetical protein
MDMVIGPPGNEVRGVANAWAKGITIPLAAMTKTARHESRNLLMLVANPQKL